MTPRSYQKKYPGSPWESEAIAHTFAERTANLVRTPVKSGFMWDTIHGVPFRVHLDIPEAVVAPCPSHYHFPTTGAAARVASRVVRYVAEGRSVWLHGPPGTGKDALFHYISNRARIPFLYFQIRPDADIQDWFFSLGFENGSTTWIEGALLKALRDGYVDAEGARHPYMILISDVDRADASQVEVLRSLLESDVRRVPLPGGKYAPVLPGTRIVATANTMGGGDETGRLVSTRPVDSSIINRFEAKARMPWLAWEDERAVIVKKFPLLAKLMSLSLETVFKDVVTAIRTACENGDLFGEMSLRDISYILTEFESLIRQEVAARPVGESVTLPNLQEILFEAFDVFVEGLAFESDRRGARSHLEPFKNMEQVKWEGRIDHLLKGEISLHD